jgi:hypothetical protein
MAASMDDDVTKPIRVDARVGVPMVVARRHDR